MAQINVEYKNNRKSSFIQLNKFCMVEFIKTDINNAEDNSDMTFSGIKTYMFKYPMLSYSQIYYDDEYVRIPESDDEFYTNNIEKYAVLDFDSTRYAKVISHDGTSKLTDYLADKGRIEVNEKKNEELSMTGDNIVYDLYRFHFATGFNIYAYGGIVLGIKARMNNGDYVKLANIKVDTTNWFDNTDNLEDSLVTQNPEPIYINNTSFINYVDVRVPSLDYMNYLFSQATSKSTEDMRNCFTGRITDLKYADKDKISPNGFNKTAPVVVSCDVCESMNLFRGDNNVAYEIYNISEHNEGSMALSNPYEDVAAHIEEATDGNYFMYRAQYDDKPIDSFIYSITGGNPSEWSMIHQLNVIEHVDDKNGHILDYVTSRNTMYQDYSNTNDEDGSYADFLMFRPVLKYAGNGCVDFGINYTLTMVNNRTGENVVKTSSISSKNVRAYSKNTIGIDINMGSIVKHKVYNKIYISQDASTDLFVDPDFEKKYREGSKTQVIERSVRYPLYVDYNAITVSDDVTGSQNLASTTILYKQGDLRLLVKPFENYFRFKIYTTKEGNAVPLELDPTNTYKLVFLINGNKVSYESMHDENIDPLYRTRMSLGEITFNVPEADAVNLVNSNTRDFYIVYDNYSTLQTSILYFGFFFNQNEYTSYQDHVEQIKQQYGIITETNARMNDTIAAVQSQTTEIPYELYVPGNVDQASDGNEKASVYKTKPVEQNS